MINIFSSSQDDLLPENDKIISYINENPQDAIKQVNHKISSLNDTLSSSDMVDLYILASRGIENSTVEDIIISKLFNYFINNSKYLIDKDHYSLSLLMELFIHHPELFENENNITKYIMAGYPMLTYVYLNIDSDIKDSIYKFILKLANDTRFKQGHYLINKFIKDNPDSPFVYMARQFLIDATKT